MHHSEKRHLALLDSFNVVTETAPVPYNRTLLHNLTWSERFHKTLLMLLDSFTWRYRTISPDVPEPNQFHLRLLDSFIWRYRTVSPDVIGQFHLALLNRITWCYWTVSPGITEPSEQFHLALLKLIWRNKTAIEQFNVQRSTL